MDENNSFTYKDFLMYQLWQLRDSIDEEDERTVEEVEKKMSTGWKAFFENLEEYRPLVVRLMSAEDIVKHISSLGRYIEDMTEFIRRLPAKTVIERWDELVVGYDADKDVCFDHVKNEIECGSCNDLNMWVERGISLEKLYDHFKNYSFAKPEYAACGYYDFMSTLKGLNQTPIWDKVKDDLLKYKNNKYVPKDIFENREKWAELGFNFEDFLTESYKAKWFDIMTLGPKEAVWRYVGLDYFMETVDFKWLIDQYAEEKDPWLKPENCTSWFIIFISDYDEVKGSTDKLIRRFIDEIGYKPRYTPLLWDLLMYDKGRNLDMERIARMVSVKIRKRDRESYKEKLSSMGMSDKKLKEIFDN